MLLQVDVVLFNRVFFGGKAGPTLTIVLIFFGCSSIYQIMRLDGEVALVCRQVFVLVEVFKLV